MRSTVNDTMEEEDGVLYTASTGCARYGNVPRRSCFTISFVLDGGTEHFWMVSMETSVPLVGREHIQFTKVRNWRRGDRSILYPKSRDLYSDRTFFGQNGVFYFSPFQFISLHVVTLIKVEREIKTRIRRRSGRRKGRIFGILRKFVCVWFNVLSRCVREINTRIQLNASASDRVDVRVCARVCTHYNGIEKVNRITSEKENFDFTKVSDK